MVKNGIKMNKPDIFIHVALIHLSFWLLGDIRVKSTLVCT